MEYQPSFRDSLHADVKPSYLMHAMTEEEIDKKKFGLPKSKKYPMPDADHVRSAIKFFNYVTPSNEKELAKNILARIDEYGMDINSINIGDNNRFKKYIQHDVLMHHGIKGMHWGVRRFQNSDGSLTKAGKSRYRQTIDNINESIDNWFADRGDRLRAKGKTHENTWSTVNDLSIRKSEMREQRKKHEEYMNKMNEYKKREKQQRERQRRIEKARDDAYKKVFKKDKINFMDIYKEMGADLNEEDNDYYKEVEAAWREKHGFKPLSEIK